MSLLERRRARLSAARLYLICDATPGGRSLESVLAPALRGGVDVFQLRCKGATDEEILAAATVAREWCEVAGALFILNDRPDLVAATGADGVHVGQDDASVAQARAIAGPDALVGQSTHSPEQVDAGAVADYLGVGPVHTTPTKPGRPAVGLELVTYAARNAKVPWFAIGGVDEATINTVMAAGANRAAIVRAIAEAQDPEAVTRRLAHALDEGPPGVRRKRKSSEERNVEIRAALDPIAPDERPTPLVVAVATAILLGTVNLVLAATGHSGKGGAGTLLVYCALDVRRGVGHVDQALRRGPALPDPAGDPGGLLLPVPAARVVGRRRRAELRRDRPGGMVVLEAGAGPRTAPGPARRRRLTAGRVRTTRSLHCEAWPKASTPSSSARVPAATSPRSDPRSSGCARR